MRIKLVNGKQKELIKKIKSKHQFTWGEFSKVLNVSEVALIGWSKEKNLLPLEIYEKLDPSKEYKNQILEIKADYWGKVMGGLNSRGSLKEITIPGKSEKLAELIGIVLGDGNINYFKKGKKIGTYMVRISGHRINDRDYITRYVSGLLRSLFNVEPKIIERKNNEIMVVAHSKKLVEFFVGMGLISGDKIKNQITIPKWIFKNKDYTKSCIRGLIDTDGRIYSLKPRYPDYYQLSFKNNNITLIKDLRKAFLKLGYPISKVSKNNRLYLTQKEYISKFYKEIGSSNNKHLKRYSPVV